MIFTQKIPKKKVKEGTFKIVESAGSSDEGDIAYVKGYYVRNGQMIHFKKIADENDTFIVKGNISEEDKKMLGEMIDNKILNRLSEFD